MSDVGRLDLLFKEIEDKYVRENFIKLKRYLDCLEAEQGDTTALTPGGGTGGTSTSSPWTTGEKPAGAVSTTTLDSRPLSSLVCAYYQVCMKEQGGSRTKTLKIDIRKVDTDVEDQVYAKNGDVMNIAINAVTVGTNIELQIQNNESYGVDVSFARLTL